jgi:hypothetical protein
MDKFCGGTMRVDARPRALAVGVLISVYSSADRPQRRSAKTELKLRKAWAIREFTSRRSRKPFGRQGATTLRLAVARLPR